MTHGREAGLTPGTLSLAPGGPNGRHFAAGNALSPSARRARCRAVEFRGKRRQSTAVVPADWVRIQQQQRSTPPKRAVIFPLTLSAGTYWIGMPSYDGHGQSDRSNTQKRKQLWACCPILRCRLCRLRALVRIISSTPRVFLCGCSKARLAGNSGTIANNSNAAAAAEGQPNVEIILTRVLTRDRGFGAAPGRRDSCAVTRRCLVSWRRPWRP